MMGQRKSDQSDTKQSLSEFLQAKFKNPETQL